MIERPPMSTEKLNLLRSRGVGSGDALSLPRWSFRKLPNGYIQAQVREPSGALYAEIELTPEMWAQIGNKPTPSAWPVE